MKIVCTATLLVPVVTEVEAETEEEAIRIAKKRLVGKDLSKEWVLNESNWNTVDININ